MNITLPQLFKNEYHFRLIGPADEVKQDIICHNIVLNNFWTKQNQSSPYTGWGNYNYFQGTAPSGLRLGKGTGTPSVTDTALFSPLWAIKQANARAFSISADKKIGEAKLTYIFPANSSYVGVVTEAGLTMCDRRGDIGEDNLLVTHCLIIDSEGNPISINKTADDKLEVTVTWRVIVPDVLNNFKFLQADQGLLANLWKMAGSWGSNTAGMFYVTDLTINRNRILRYTGDRPAIDFSNIEKTYNTRKLTFNTQRINANVGNNRYYPCISLTGICYCALPNEEVFPAYNITGITIGTGNGTTKQFKNPLNYFKKDTEKVYIDGVLQTRGVDYTIDYKNNASLLPELSAGNYITRQYSDKVMPSTTNAMLFIPEEANYGTVDDSNLYGMWLNKAYHVELETTCEINLIKLAGISFNGNAANIRVKIEYSVDDTSYAELITTTSFNSRNGITIPCDTIVAKYLKFTIVEQTSNTAYGGTFSTQNSYKTFLGYVGDPNITFINAPTENAIITMDVDMDIPFKNENYVIDLSADITV